MTQPEICRTDRTGLLAERRSVRDRCAVRQQQWYLQRSRLHADATALHGNGVATVQREPERVSNDRYVCERSTLRVVNRHYVHAARVHGEPGKVQRGQPTAVQFRPRRLDDRHGVRGARALRRGNARVR